MPRNSSAKPIKAETRRVSLSGKSRCQRKKWMPPEGMPLKLTRDVRGGRICGAQLNDGTFCTAPPHNAEGMRAKGKEPPFRCKKHGGATPGAPKGNQNALKHGIYVDALLPGEEDLDPEIETLDAEINISKLRLRRALIAEAQQEGKEDPLEVLEETVKTGSLLIMRNAPRREEPGKSGIAAKPNIEHTIKRGRVDYARQIALIINQLVKLLSLRAMLSTGDPLDALAKARLAREALAEAAGLMNSAIEEP